MEDNSAFNTGDSIAELKAIPLNISEFDYEIDADDLFQIGDSLIDQKGLVSHHLESANNFYNNGIKQIITQGFKIQKDIKNERDILPEDRKIKMIRCEVIPTDVQLKPPTTIHYKTSREGPLYPKVALAREKVYSGSLSLSCDIKATAYLHDNTTIERTDAVRLFRIGRVPIIKGSVACNTYGKSNEALMQMGEDPADPGGYFIVKGEWAVDCTENITYNQAKIYINQGYGKSRVRGEFISKPGDTYQNSAMLLIRFFNDNTLTVEVSRNKLADVQIPFYLLFRALGWNNDHDVMDWIIYDYDDDANKKILICIVDAINAKYGKTNYKEVYNHIDALKHIVDLVPEDNFKNYNLKDEPENYHRAITEILETIDEHFLPHIGTTSASRHTKLKFLGLLIRKVLMVYLGYIPQTDRDSYRNKRVHSAGDNYAKALKTIYNTTVVQPIKKRIMRDFKNTSFSQVNLANLVKSAIYADDFERLIVQTIVAGNKATLKVRKRNVVNRLLTQQLGRKNHLSTIATMRQVSATSADSAKQSERAAEMRRVHMSALGYICVSHSPPEGENVGINKQMAMFAFVAPASSSEVLKNKLLKDPELIHEEWLTPIEIYRGNFARTYVNGHLLGYVSKSLDFVNRYRNLRRQLEINPFTTIYWDNTQNEIQFHVDVGRMCRPLLIVYNNQRDNAVFKKDTTAKFDQGLAITQDDITALFQRKKTIDDLLREQKIEYITPEEQENCYICPNFGQLKQHRHNELNEYTHCDIPQALIGITAMTAPFGNHNQAPRVTYQTSQAKQTCGYYAMNWPFRMDKETFLQYTNEIPLVKTAVNKYIFPNGNNVMVAIMCYTGQNQEDSLIINKAAIERGLFDGSKFTFYKTEFEQKEELGNPDASKTEGIKSANYEKLSNLGVVSKGQHVMHDDVLIGKYIPIPKDKNEQYVFADRSIVYKEGEEAIVHNVVIDRNEDDMKFCKVALRKVRPVAIGDKFSSRSG